MKHIRCLLLGLCTIVALTCGGARPAGSQPLRIPVNVVTSTGDFIIELYPELDKSAVERCLTLVRKKRFAGGSLRRGKDDVRLALATGPRLPQLPIRTKPLKLWEHAAVMVDDEIVLVLSARNTRLASDPRTHPLGIYVGEDYLLSLPAKKPTPIEKVTFMAM